MALRLISRSPRWSGLVVTVIPEKLASQELDASIAAPGPHDFAVRLGVFVRREKSRLTPKRPPHSGPTHRDDRETPLVWAGMGRSYNSDFQKCEAKYF